MRNLVLVIALFNLALGFSQDLPSNSKDRGFTIEAQRVGIACGFAGMPTQCVARAQELVAKQDQEALAAMLFSLSGAEAYVSALALVKVLDWADELTDEEEKRYQAIINGKVSFKICSGCMVNPNDYTVNSLPAGFELRLVNYLKRALD